MSNKLAIIFVTVLLAFKGSDSARPNVANDDDLYNETEEQLKQLHDNVVDILNRTQIQLSKIKESYSNSSDEFVADGQEEADVMINDFKDQLHKIFDKAIHSIEDVDAIQLCFSDENIINDIPVVYKNEIYLCLNNSDTLINQALLETENNCNALFFEVKELAERLRHCPTTDVECISPVAEDIKTANESVPIYINEQVAQLLLNVKNITNGLEACTVNALVELVFTGEDTVHKISDCIDNLMSTK